MSDGVIMVVDGNNAAVDYIYVENEFQTQPVSTMGIRQDKAITLHVKTKRQPIALEDQGPGSVVRVKGQY